eukprot:EG_transcript_37060
MAGVPEISHCCRFFCLLFPSHPSPLRWWPLFANPGAMSDPVPWTSPSCLPARLERLPAGFVWFPSSVPASVSASVGGPARLLICSNFDASVFLCDGVIFFQTTNNAFLFRSLRCLWMPFKSICGSTL